MNPLNPNPARSHSMPNPHPDTLNPTDRAKYDRFVALVDAAEFTPLPDTDEAERRRRLDSGHQSNVISGNPGTPLSWAKLQLLFERRVPKPTSTDLLVAFATRNKPDVH